MDQVFDQLTGRNGQSLCRPPEECRGRIGEGKDRLVPATGGTTDGTPMDQPCDTLGLTVTGLALAQRLLSALLFGDVHHRAIEPGLSVLRLDDADKVVNPH